jgi:hypothetical protein
VSSHFYLGRSWIPALRFDDLHSFGVDPGAFWANFWARILGFWGILGIGFGEDYFIPVTQLRRSECSWRSADHF